MLPTSSQLPADCGLRLFPVLVDSLAASDPDRPFASIPRSDSSVEDGFQDVGFRVFARAVNRAAWWLKEALGDAARDFPTVAYMGPHDLRYLILIFAAVKTGYKLFVPSLRNSPAAHVALLDEYSCGILLIPQDAPPLDAIAKMLLGKRSMRSLEVPSLAWFLEGGDIPVYPYTKTFAEAKYEPFVVMHTSGTTGLPKPIVSTHNAVAVIDAMQKLPVLGVNPYLLFEMKGRRLFSLFPMFHSGGLTVILAAISYGFTYVFYPPQPPTADLINRMHLHADVSVSLIPPTILVELAGEAETLDNLSRLQYVLTGGGPLPNITGELVSARTHLSNIFGSSETILLPTELIDSEDWQYIKICPIYGHEMRLYDKDLYELVAVRNDDQTEFQGVFRMFPHLWKWAFNDLFSKHPSPSKEDLWQFRGRRDDIVVYSTGEKFNPVTMEGTIAANPALAGALVYGEGRIQSSLLVEPKGHPKSQADQERLLDEIWPSVQKANEGCATFARIYRAFVVFTVPERPLPRSSKGAVQRRAAIELYKRELNDMYEREGGPGQPETQAPTEGSYDEMSLQERVLDIVRRVPGFEEAMPNTNLVGMGLDSLQAMTITHHIKRLLAKLGKPSEHISSRTIYTHHSVDQLISTLLGTDSATHSSAPSPESLQHKMQRLYELYTADLPVSARSPIPAPHSGRTVLLTGSTGSLGSYILDTLLRDPRVRRIYCLNRAHDGLARQLDSCRTKGLGTSFPHTRVCFLHCDLSAPYFGLASPPPPPPAAACTHAPLMYVELLEQVTDIIHNAWLVNSNLSLDSIAPPLLRALRQLIDFSARSRHGAALLFISSIGAVYASAGAAVVPEALVTDPTAAAPTGYAQAKLLAERVLGAAHGIASVPAAVVRVGQIAGPSAAAAGMWPKNEWLPSVIASSANVIRKLPLTLPTADSVTWVPVDKCATVLVEFMFSASVSANGRRVAVTRGVGGANYAKADSSSIELKVESWEKEHNDEVKGRVKINEEGIDTAQVGMHAEGKLDDETGPRSEETDSGIPVYHLVNPRATTWATLLPTIKASLGIDTVEFSEWIDLLRKSADAECNTETGVETEIASDGDGKKTIPRGELTTSRNPALKLLEFLQDMALQAHAPPQFALEKSLQQSETLAHLEAVTPALMGTWLRQWGF